MENAEEIARLRRWINDLQSGMWINCVYCGHRYGPRETTPVSMADALKLHVASCEAHPMSKLLKACRLAFHTLSSLEAVRDGIPDEALREYIEVVRSAIEEATRVGGK
jgi:predicted RNA-binding protein